MQSVVLVESFLKSTNGDQWKFSNSFNMCNLNVTTPILYQEMEHIGESSDCPNGNMGEIVFKLPIIVNHSSLEQMRLTMMIDAPKKTFSPQTEGQIEYGRIFQYEFDYKFDVVTNAIETKTLQNSFVPPNFKDTMMLFASEKQAYLDAQESTVKIEQKKRKSRLHIIQKELEQFEFESKPTEDPQKITDDPNSDPTKITDDPNTITTIFPTLTTTKKTKKTKKPKKPTANKIPVYSKKLSTTAKTTEEPDHPDEPKKTKKPKTTDNPEAMLEVEAKALTVFYTPRLLE